MRRASGAIRPRSSSATPPSGRWRCSCFASRRPSRTPPRDYLPHLVTGYLWDLAKCFSGFFENCPVLKAETPELRDSRLLLVDLVGRVIKQALDLLGIRTVERM